MSFRAPLGATVIRTGRVMAVCFYSRSNQVARSFVLTHYGGSKPSGFQDLFCSGYLLSASTQCRGSALGSGPAKPLLFTFSLSRSSSLYRPSLLKARRYRLVRITQWKQLSQSRFANIGQIVSLFRLCLPNTLTAPATLLEMGAAVCQP